MGMKGTDDTEELEYHVSLAIASFLISAYDNWQGRWPVVDLHDEFTLGFEFELLNVKTVYIISASCHTEHATCRVPFVLLLFSVDLCLFLTWSVR